MYCEQSCDHLKIVFDQIIMVVLIDDDQSDKDGTVAGGGNGGRPLFPGNNRVGNMQIKMQMTIQMEIYMKIQLFIKMKIQMEMQMKMYMQILSSRAMVKHVRQIHKYTISSSTLIIKMIKYCLQVH